MEQRLFYYNKTKYILELKPQIERYFKGKTMLQFGIVLPYYVPFVDSTHITYKINKNELNHFHFSSFQHKEQIYTGEFKGNPTELEINRTRVEMSFISKKKLDMNDCDSTFLTEKFDMLISHLNTIITSYMLIEKDFRVYKVRLEHLDPIILFRYIDLKSYKELDQGLFHLNYNKLNNDSNVISHDCTRKVMSFIEVIGNRKNPFTYCQEINLNAQRHSTNGDYRESIIDAQTAVEIFLTMLYRELLFTEENKTQNINAKVESIAFKNMVLHQFQKRIGGEFDIYRADSVIGKWWIKTYLLRNKVVHEGYSPSKEESFQAINASNELFKYVVELLHTESNKIKYPALSVFLIPPKDEYRKNM